MTPIAVSRSLILAVSVFVCALGSGLAAAELDAPTSLSAVASSSTTIGLSRVETNTAETGHSVEGSGNPLSGFVGVLSKTDRVDLSRGSFYGSAGDPRSS